MLERTGVKIFEDTALKILADGGAHVDFDAKVAKIPSYMVKEALQSAPSRIVVANPVGKRVIFLERNNVYFGTGTDLPTYMDPYTGEPRATTLKDIEDIAKVVEHSPNYDYVSNHGLAKDVPQHLHDMVTLKAMRKYCSKPNMATATDRGNLMALIDMCAEMAGGYDALKQNPTLMLYNEPVSPLMNGEEAMYSILCAVLSGQNLVTTMGIRELARWVICPCCCWWMNRSTSPSDSSKAFHMMMSLWRWI